MKTLSNSDLHSVAPSIFAPGPSDSRSDRYKFIPTLDIIDGLRRANWLPVNAGATNVRIKSNKNHCHHMIRFRRDEDLKATTGNVVELVLFNSHDGGSSLQLHAGVFRFVCANGMVLADSTLQHVKIRHTGREVEDALKGALAISMEAPMIAGKIETFKSLIVSWEDQILLAKLAMGARWKGKKVPFHPDQFLTLRRAEDAGDDLWSVFNRIQENVTKGGMSAGFVEEGRWKTRTARKIKSVAEDLRLNKDLWEMTEEFAAVRS